MNLDELNFTNNKFLEFLTCSICQTVFNDPYRIGCGHTFCNSCITQWMKSSKNTCPICRKKVVKTSMSRDKIAYNIINSLEVKCSNKSKSLFLFIQIAYGLETSKISQAIKKYVFLMKEPYQKKSDETFSIHILILTIHQQNKVLIMALNPGFMSEKKM